LLEVQEELSVKKCQQLEAVKCTAYEKLTTWGHRLLKIKNNTNKIVDKKAVEKAVKTALHESDREFNVVMFYVEEENENGDSSEEFNNEVALDIMKCCGLTSFA
jgi:hypothetical protein